MFTKCRISSHTTGKQYAPAGAKVAIINQYNHVAICEYNGIRFPTTTENLTDDPNLIIPDQPQLPQLSAITGRGVAKGRGKRR